MPLADLLFSLWLALQDAEPRDDDADDDDEGGGLSAPVPAPVQPRQPHGWPPRIRLFLPGLVPVPVPVGS